MGEYTGGVQSGGSCFAQILSEGKEDLFWPVLLVNTRQSETPRSLLAEGKGSTELAMFVFHKALLFNGCYLPRLLQFKLQPIGSAVTERKGHFF